MTNIIMVNTEAFSGQLKLDEVKKKRRSKVGGHIFFFSFKVGIKKEQLRKQAYRKEREKEIHKVRRTG